MNLDNKIRLTKDIVIFENFVSEDECKKMINALDAQAANGGLTWMPISFYESYSSVLPQDNDQEVIDAGLSPTIFQILKTRCQKQLHQYMI